MPALNRVLLLALHVLARMQRHHSVLALGAAWQEATAGAFATQLAPLLLEAAQAAASAPAAACWQSKVEQLAASGQQHVVALEGARQLVHDRLAAAGLPPLPGPAASLHSPSLAVGALR
jgi:predicted nucleic acid-binding Zn ribbon protein